MAGEFGIQLVLARNVVEALGSCLGDVAHIVGVVAPSDYAVAVVPQSCPVVAGPSGFVEAAVPRSFVEVVVPSGFAAAVAPQSSAVAVGVPSGCAVVRVRIAAVRSVVSVEEAEEQAAAVVEYTVERTAVEGGILSAGIDCCR